MIGTCRLWAPNRVEEIRVGLRFEALKILMVTIVAFKHFYHICRVVSVLGDEVEYLLDVALKRFLLDGNLNQLVKRVL